MSQEFVDDLIAACRTLDPMPRCVQACLENIDIAEGRKKVLQCSGGCGREDIYETNTTAWKCSECCNREWLKVELGIQES